MAEFLKVDGIKCAYGGLLAVCDVTFAYRESEILGIIGPNGAGKSTLFNLIAGMSKPTAGRIYFDGGRIDGLAVERIARLGVVKTFQTSRPFASMSFLENVAIAAFARTYDKRVAWRVAEEKLALTGLSDQASLPARGASTGQRKRLEIARLLALEPRLLLLDEPFGGVDMTAIEGLIELLLSIRTAGASIMIIEHNIGAAVRLVDRLIAMNLGAVIADGVPSDVIQDPAVVSAYLGNDEVDDAA